MKTLDLTFASKLLAAKLIVHGRAGCAAESVDHLEDVLVGVDAITPCEWELYTPITGPGFRAVIKPAHHISARTTEHRSEGGTP